MLSTRAQSRARSGPTRSRETRSTTGSAASEGTIASLVGVATTSSSAARTRTASTAGRARPVGRRQRRRHPPLDRWPARQRQRLWRSKAGHVHHRGPRLRPLVRDLDGRVGATPRRGGPSRHEDAGLPCGEPPRGTGAGSPTRCGIMALRSTGTTPRPTSGRSDPIAGPGQDHRHGPARQWCRAADPGPPTVAITDAESRAHAVVSGDGRA